MPAGSKPQQQPGQAMELEAKGMDLDALAAAALRRVASQINRAAGQHLRAMRRTSPPTTSTKEPTA